MSLQGTVLPNSILADLFRFSLIEQRTEELYKNKSETAAAGNPVVFQGKNLHHITIGVHFTGEELMPAEALDFLVNILKACQRNTDHVAIVNFAAADPALADVVSQLNPQIIILFGSYPLFSLITPEMADFTLAEPQGMKIIRVPGFEKLMQTTPEGRTLKGKLWLMLKQLFNL